MLIPNLRVPGSSVRLVLEVRDPGRSPSPDVGPSRSGSEEGGGGRSGGGGGGRGDAPLREAPPPVRVGSEEGGGGGSLHGSPLFPAAGPQANPKP